MGLVTLVMSSVGKCVDAVCIVLDVNFLVVHALVRTTVAAVAFIISLPALVVNTVVHFGDLVTFGMTTMADATSSAAHGTVAILGSLVLSLEGLLESLKMMGYLATHVLLRGKEQFCRGLLSMLEGCGIGVSLVVYFANTVVNFALIATQNIYLAVVSVCQTVSSPLHKVLELTLTSLTFLYSCLVGTSTFLWSPCKLLLEFLVSLVHMFISVFILNTHGLLLTVTIALTTTAYLNPELTRATAVRIGNCMNCFPALCRLHSALHQIASALRHAPRFARGAMQNLPRILHHLELIKRDLLPHLSRLSSQLGLAQRIRLRRVSDNRAHGDGDPGEEPRDPPDGRVGDGPHWELLDLVSPSTSRDRQLKKEPLLRKDSQPLPAENLLTLLKEQEERKKCVICQDCCKTVVLLPCRHLCLCRDCTDILLRQPIYQHNCPLCRHIIFSTMDVYL